MFDVLFFWNVFDVICISRVSISLTRTTGKLLGKLREVTMSTCDSSLRYLKRGKCIELDVVEELLQLSLYVALPVFGSSY